MSGLPPDRRIEFRVGIHLGDVVEEADGDLMGEGVNIAARLEGIAAPGAICLSEDAYRQVKGRLDLAVSDLGPTQLKNIADPIRVYSLEAATLRLPTQIPRRSWPGKIRPAAPLDRRLALHQSWRPSGAMSISSMASRRASRPTCHGYGSAVVIGCNTAFTYKGKSRRL